jgi:Tfp pilus assembly protein PilE
MTQRGVTFAEMFVVVAIMVVLAGVFVVPAYRAYGAARAPLNAAQTLAEDLALLERVAKDGGRNQGSSLIITSTNPLAYRGYRGRPTSIDPNSALGAVLVEHQFTGVVLAGGPIGTSTPLLFASNGSAQYVSSGVVADQHATIEFSLTQLRGSRTALVDLDLFTGAVSLR